MSKSGSEQSNLLYIISVGHSGSTLLDLLCGTIPKVFSMGEVQFLSWQLLQGEVSKDPQTYCSCGDNFEKCSFWNPIFKRISQENKIDIYNDPKIHDFSLNRYIERHKTKFRLRLINKIFELTLKHKATSFLSKIFYWYYLPSIKRNWNLFDNVAKESKSEYVIDSSKDIIRYILLRMHRPNNVKLIILKRDVKGVASSSHSGLTEEIVKERARYWLEFYSQMIQPALKITGKDKYIKVNYEDFCKDPTNVRNKIINFLNMEKLNSDVKHIEPYNYHCIQGNPIRLRKDRMEIVYDERWRKRLSPDQIKKLDKISFEESLRYSDCH